MSKVAVLVDFTVKPEHRAEFLKRMEAHAAGSLEDQEGCLRFDVLLPKEVQFDVPVHEPDTSRICLYELYRDEEAFYDQLNSERVTAMRATYAPMIERRRITRFTVHE